MQVGTNFALLLARQLEKDTAKMTDYELRYTPTRASHERCWPQQLIAASSAEAFARFVTLVKAHGAIPGRWHTLVVVPLDGERITPCPSELHGWDQIGVFPRPQWIS